MEYNLYKDDGNEWDEWDDDYDPMDDEGYEDDYYSENDFTFAPPTPQPVKVKDSFKWN